MVARRGRATGTCRNLSPDGRRVTVRQQTPALPVGAQGISPRRGLPSGWDTEWDSRGTPPRAVCSVALVLVSRVAGMDAGRDAAIAALHMQGFSVRAIAKRVDLSRAGVHRVLTRLRAGTGRDGDDDDDDGMALLDAGAGYEAHGPFVFAGMERVSTTPPDGDAVVVSNEPRFVDARGEQCDMLAVWRADYGDGSVGNGYCANAEQQVIAAGWCKVSTGAGYWRW